MDYFYSAKTNSFYPLSLKADYENGIGWPDDAVPVNGEMFTEFSEQPPQGKKRVAGLDGHPAWGDISPPTYDEIVAQAAVEKQNRINTANDYMNSKQWPGKAAISRLKGEEITQYGLWLDYLDALEAIDTSSAPHISWPIPPVVLAK